jgi:hypothetical protein
MPEITLSYGEVNKAILALRALKGTKIHRGPDGKPNFNASTKVSVLIRQLMPFAIQYEEDRLKLQDEYTARETVDGVLQPIKVLDIGTGQVKKDEVQYTDVTKYQRELGMLSNVPVKITPIAFTAAEMFSLVNDDTAEVELADVMPLVDGGEDAVLAYLAAQGD